MYLFLAGWHMLRPHYVPWVAASNLRPLETIRADLALGPAHAVRNIGGGLLRLAPLGFLLPLAGARLRVSSLGSFSRTVFAGMMVALALECARSDVPGQVFDVDSLLLNTTGVALAYLVVVPAARSRLRRAAPLPQGPSPMITRVGVAPRSDASSFIRS